ncbi:uncharacterized protein (DUF4415 family) [Rhizobium sp. AG855]|nr:uncharacterized protein (DUF4415 family) [Rhizobium sp. AG855]
MSKPDDDPENPEWTAADFARARPASELPEELRAFFPKTRGIQKAPTKIPISLRLSAEVVEHFRATGPGWQGRIDEILKKAAGL